MALKDSWQQQKRQRQQEVIQRRNQVSEALTLAQRERQERASQLRSDLSLFRETLVSDDRSRNLEFQHFYLQLQHETQSFLAEARGQRQKQAQDMAQQLCEVIQNLQQQTADFLILTGAERAWMAQQLANDLQKFQIALSESVSSLRQDIQSELQELRIETDLLLHQSQQQRIKTQICLTQHLVVFTEALRSSVQIYLSEVSANRQAQAASLDKKLHQTRVDRTAQTKALFAGLADFRIQIQQYHASLKSTVWGDAAIEMLGIAQKPSTAPLKSPAPYLVKSTPNLVQGKAAPTEAIMPKVATPVLEADYEEKIYQYIDLIKGARLTEIESSLGISRFQAVDALRSLIQKGLVTQRDRVYRIQEDFTV
jgi:gas vesicle GvpC-like protein